MLKNIFWHTLHYTGINIYDSSGCTWTEYMLKILFGETVTKEKVVFYLECEGQRQPTEWGWEVLCLKAFKYSL
jgi:hypothetical protein